MKDLNTLYKKTGSSKVFHNFFRSAVFSNAYETLQSQGLRPEQIIVKTHSTRNHPSQTLAHPLMALAFMQWCDPMQFQKTLLKLISSNVPAEENFAPGKTTTDEETTDE